MGNQGSPATQDLPWLHRDTSEGTSMTPALAELASGSYRPYELPGTC